MVELCGAAGAGVVLLLGEMEVEPEEEPDEEPDGEAVEELVEVGVVGCSPHAETRQRPAVMARSEAWRSGLSVK
jgi:hypothetical protein